jgi:signal transduction histidine kinase
MNALPIRARLAVMYAVVLFGVLLVTSLTVLWQQERIGLRRVDRELDTLTTTLANGLQDELRESGNPVRAAREAQKIVDTGNHSVAILDRKGNVLAAKGAASAFLSAEVSDSASHDAHTLTTAKGTWRVRQRQEGEGDAALTLLIGTPLTDVEREQRESREAMFIGIPIVFVLAVGGGLYLSSLTVRPVVKALEAQRRFTADAAHELRTPVSVIRAAADVTLSRESRDEGEYRDTLKIIAAQARGLGRLVQNMLVLARADAGAYPLRPVDLYLDDLVVDCRRALEVLAAERGVQVSSDQLQETPYRGDEDLLRQLILNILQNAVQHTPRCGVVTVDLHGNAERIALRVKNTGLGIPVEDRARVFERFVQLDPSRRSEGAGLGLPIARWIAEMHHGEVFVESSDAVQTTFCVVLPIAART